MHQAPFLAGLWPINSSITKPDRQLSLVRGLKRFLAEQMLDKSSRDALGEIGEAMSRNPSARCSLHLQPRRLLCTRWRPPTSIARESGTRQASPAEPVRRIEPADSGSVQNSMSDSFKTDPTEEGRGVAQRALRSKFAPLSRVTHRSSRQVQLLVRNQ